MFIRSPASSFAGALVQGYEPIVSLTRFTPPQGPWNLASCGLICAPGRVTADTFAMGCGMPLALLCAAYANGQAGRQCHSNLSSWLSCHYASRTMHARQHAVILMQNHHIPVKCFSISPPTVFAHLRKDLLNLPSLIIAPPLHLLNFFRRDPWFCPRSDMLYIPTHPDTA